jgi:DtxR family transcriptional regulator, manganese transport regulator
MPPSISRPAKPAPTAESHRRTRADHATETAEDYVEAIADTIDANGACRLVDLATRFGVSHVTANRIVGRLQKEGFVITEPYRPIELTSRGKRLARRCRQRHVIVYQFLLLIGVDEKNAAIDAEGIEHHVSLATLHRFQAAIDRSSINETGKTKHEA